MDVKRWIAAAMMCTGGRKRPSRSAQSGAIKRASYDLLGKGKWVKLANRIERECDRIADELYGFEVFPGKSEVFFVNDAQSKKDVLAVFEQRLSEL